MASPAQRVQRSRLTTRGQISFMLGLCEYLLGEQRRQLTKPIITDKERLHIEAARTALELVREDYAERSQELIDAAKTGRK